ncbi:phage tail sheath subtilisin-like domain-containing protein [Sphingomonas sp. SUN039]|uniref:phage tail sheath family protein n=1 Tax=Sphingomonas sp. SUN039 TaxID=2937787 RepID=UPI0021640227|nr:phage tail sheath subtilisin-like domain-containing protein [Sphingomonas sp. SUN039]UVO55705.1 phage tail sheath subtilisin-like domain-containing protein [Sphingomonas sp. SUN039]
MAISPTYPGVYLQEIDSGVRTLAGVPTSIAALIGRALRGPVNEPTTCFSFGEFSRRFGGLWTDGPLSYAVADFYDNGGGQSEIVRLFKAKAGGDGIATIDIGALRLRAANPGSWGNALNCSVTHPSIADPTGTQAAADRYGLLPDQLFDLRVEDTGNRTVEVFRNLTTEETGGSRRFDRVLADASNLVRCAFNLDGSVRLGNRPANNSTGTGTGGDDGDALTPGDYIGAEADKTGLFALLKADIFNLLCIPPDVRGGTLDKSVWEAAAAFCKKRRALLIVDPPASWDANPAEAAAKVKAEQLDPNKMVLSLTNADNAALYFPRLRKRDPLRAGQIDTFVPCGAVAGIIARTDVNRGVWKAPAGMASTISGADGLTVKLTDDENGLLNPIAVNCLRSFPNIGRVVWGARTMKGSDQLSDDYRYVPVRRLALYIEESLFRGTQWVVFEGNDEPLWAQIRLSVGSFMHRLFRQGAFQGKSPREAYFVQCDGTTTTQDDRNRGIVNIVVGFAPLQPAEFVIISIQQIRNAA